MKKALISTVAAVLVSAAIKAEDTDGRTEQIFSHYLSIQKSLSQDSLVGIQSAAQAIVSLSGQANPASPEIGEIFSSLKGAASTLSSRDLKGAREGFFELSKPLLLYLNAHYQGEQKYFRYFCSMEKKAWIQSMEEVANPYKGEAMLSCGELIP